MIAFPPILSVTLDDMIRFWSKVQRTGSCWIWTGAIPIAPLSNTGLDNNSQYGQFKFKQQAYKAHRVAYFLEYRIDPREQLACHECNNSICVRPEHLFLGTQVENMQHRVDSGNLQRGELHPRSVLHTLQIPSIRQRLALGETDYMIAKSLGVSQGAISAIQNRTTWKHVLD